MVGSYNGRLCLAKHSVTAIIFDIDELLAMNCCGFRRNCWEELLKLVSSIPGVYSYLQADTFGPMLSSLEKIAYSLTAFEDIAPSSSSVSLVR